jgi:hypothetical protein
VRRTNGSTTGDPSPPSVAGTLEAFYCWLMPDVHHFDPTAVNGVMPFGDPVKRPRSIVVLGVLGVPNGGNGGMGDLGGDGSIYRYDGVVVTALGPLWQMWR